jgi:hypothetical protein
MGQEQSHPTSQERMIRAYATRWLSKHFKLVALTDVQTFDPDYKYSVFVGAKISILRKHLWENPLIRATTERGVDRMMRAIDIRKTNGYPQICTDARVDYDMTIMSDGHIAYLYTITLRVIKNPIKLAETTKESKKEAPMEVQKEAPKETTKGVPMEVPTKSKKSKKPKRPKIPSLDLKALSPETSTAERDVETKEIEEVFVDSAPRCESGPSSSVSAPVTIQLELLK